MSVGTKNSPSAGNCKLQTDDCLPQRRVVHLPVYPVNAYQPILMQEQVSLGWDVIDGGQGGNFLRTALRRWRADILHLHWLHPYLLRSSRLSSWMRGIRFLAEVALIRKSGTKIVWTVHNLKNHADHFSDIDLKLTRRFVKQCDLIITHSEFASTAARKQFRIPESVPVRAVRFPNYQDKYASNATRSESRAAWNVAENSFVIGYLGRVEPYKCVRELVEAFRCFPDKSFRLLIGGKASSKQYGDAIREQIGDDSRIIFYDEYIDDAKVGSFLTATDVVACPSKGILTSSSVPLAMSFGRTVIAPSEGSIPEEIGELGFLYDPNQSNGLRLAIQKCLESRDRLGQLGQQARSLSDQASPTRVASHIIDEYLKLLPGGVNCQGAAV